MKAQNLTISIPNKGCDKECPYCVSKITGGGVLTENGRDNMIRNIPKVLTVAKAAQVSSVLLTGKGEPFINYQDVLFFSEAFSEFPIEIQTNGRWLSTHILKNPDRYMPNFRKQHKYSDFLYDLKKAGVNVIAVSVDNENDPTDLQSTIKILHDEGLIVRVTFNITEKLTLSCSDGEVPLTFKNLACRCKSWGVDQMTLRNICIPNNTMTTPQSIWIKQNVNEEIYKRLVSEMKSACELEGFLVKNLPYGAKVYDYEGLSVSFSDYCIQDSNNGDDIRSLIFLEDGGLYTSWNSKASRIF